MSWLDRMRKIDKARKALEMTHKQFVPPVNPIGDAEEEQRLDKYPMSQFDVPVSEQLVRYGK